jgi:polyphosphate glucokinase
MKTLVIDVGGTNVKLLATGQSDRRRFPSGPTLTPKKMVAGVKKLTRDWDYDVVSLGYPGRVIRGKPQTEPNNLRKGWLKFNFEAALGCPVRIMNDAAMQALGSYRGGTMLFLGLGTGLGSALIADSVVIPIQMGQLTYKNGRFEDYVGEQALQRLGKKKWRRYVALLVERLIAAIHPDDVVFGGGNAKYLNKLLPRCRVVDNTFAFTGGFRMWEEEGGAWHTPKRPTLVSKRPQKTVA